MASPKQKDSNSISTPPPPPSIGKIGPYTVFVTPPAPVPAPAPAPKPAPSAVAIPIHNSPKRTPAPPVQPPPIQYPTSPIDRFAFLRHALLKLQHVHASVDDYMSNWLGLDQSKYQWALNDYYESNPLEKGEVLTKEVSNKSQTV